MKLHTNIGIYATHFIPQDLDQHIFAFAERVPINLSNASGFVRLPKARSAITVLLDSALNVGQGSSKGELHPIGLWGATTKPNFVDKIGELRAFSIEFKPSALHHFGLGSPADVIDSIVPLEDLLNKSHLDRWVAQIQEAPSFEARCQLAISFLRSCASNCPAPRESLSNFMQLAADYHYQPAPVSRVLGVSSRVVRRKAHEAFGMPLKQFESLVRFQSALRQLHPDPWEKQPNALKLFKDRTFRDYFDQSHFIHAFKALSGMTPGCYRKAMKSSGIGLVNSVPIF